MVTFRESLEKKVDRLAAASSREQWDKSIPSTLRREIALTAEQLNRQREAHRIQLRQLLKTECSVRTDLIRLKQRQPRYSLELPPERGRLKQKLSDIDKERRTLSHRLEDKMQGLEDRLLNLVHKHEQLDM